MDNVRMLMKSIRTGDTTDVRIKKIFDSTFIEWDDNKPERFGFHLSSLKSPFKGKTQLCYREQTLQSFYHAYPVVPPISTLRIYLEGWYIHLKWQKLFRESSKIIAVEIEKTRKDPIWGIWYTPDAIIILPSLSQDKRIVEIKSMGRKSYETAVLIDDPMKIHPDGYKQSQLYMHLCGIDHAILLLECKDTQEYTVISFKYDEEFCKPYIHRFNILSQLPEKYKNEDKLAKRVCIDDQEARAKSCPMRHVCFITKEEREHYRIVEEDTRTIQINASLAHE